MRRLLSFAGVLLVAALSFPSTSNAQQSVNFYLGGFVPPALHDRDFDDVLLNNYDFLFFDPGRFHGVTVGAEWLFPLGEHFDGGLGISFYSQTVPSTYANVVDFDGSEIRQNLGLRIVPFTATVRYLPIGRRDAFEPYVGGGVGVLAFRYKESGRFVDFDDNNFIFTDEFRGSGAATGPLILGGARFPVGAVSIGGEIRYQWAEGDLPTDQGFAGQTIDLSGFSYLATVKLRF